MEHLREGLIVLWVVAIGVYLAKLFIPWWNEFTLIGKLGGDKKWRIGIPNKMAWCMFYGFSVGMVFVSFIIRYPPGIPNILLMIHSLRRLMESLFMTRFSPREIHFVNFCAGLLFYVMSPMSLVMSQENNRVVCSILGILSIILNGLQFRVHYTLSRLKKYSIPQGGLFRYLTSPHYFLEMSLYLVYFLSAPSIITFLMVFFVMFNLTHASIMTYNFYREKFGEEFVSLGRGSVLPCDGGAKWLERHMSMK